jgi:hypothetical protein
MSDNNAGKGSSPRPFSVPRGLSELRLALVWGTAEEEAVAKLALEWYCKECLGEGGNE